MSSVSCSTHRCAVYVLQVVEIIARTYIYDGNQVSELTQTCAGVTLRYETSWDHMVLFLELIKTAG